MLKQHDANLYQEQKMMFEKQERSDEENKILIALLEKRLGLGNWEDIAHTVSHQIASEQLPKLQPG